MKVFLGSNPKAIISFTFSTRKLSHEIVNQKLVKSWVTIIGAKKPTIDPMLVWYFTSRHTD